MKVKMNKLFTLVELVVVIVVLSILAVIVIPNVQDFRERATVAALDSDARNIETAVDTYALKNNEEYPTEDKTRILPVTERTEYELTKEITILEDGKEVKIDVEPVLVEKLVKDGFLRQNPKNKKAEFYLVEGGDVIWFLDGVSNVSKIKENPSTPNEGPAAEEPEVNVEPNKNSPYEHVKDKEVVPTLVSDFVIETGADGFYSIKEYKGTDKDLVIPSEIEGVKVTGISSYAFNNKGLTSVVIPNTITTIGLSAFNQNKLTSLYLPDSITKMGNYAFSRNLISDLRLSNELTSIPLWGFYQNKLTTIVFPDKVQRVQQSGFEANELTSIVFGEGFYRIETSAFKTNKFEKIEFPSKISLIGGDAFLDNPNLKEVIYSKKTSGSSAFDSKVKITYIEDI